MTVSPEIRNGIAEAAAELGISPVVLATAISYETAGTFDPTKRGPTTKWGQHRGFIQFGEPQARDYGVDWNNPVGSQLGRKGAVVKYLRDKGVQPGMDLMDVYSAINAGGVGRYGASDEAAGGAQGTVADKVNSQMAGHIAKAEELFAAADTGDIGTAPDKGTSLQMDAASLLDMELPAADASTPTSAYFDAANATPLQLDAAGLLDMGSAAPPQDAGTPNDPRDDLSMPKEKGWVERVRDYYAPVEGDTYGDIVPLARSGETGELRVAMPMALRGLINNLAYFADAPRAAAAGEIDPMDRQTQEQIAQGAFDFATAGGASAAKVAPRAGAREISALTRDAAPVAKEVAAGAAETEADRVGQLIAKAARNDKKAAQELASMAKVNPEAAAAAERLGISLPADVLSDNQMIQQASGAVRAVRGSQAGADWAADVRAASGRADEVMAAIDGTSDLSSVSDRILRNLQGTRDSLKAQAKTAYNAVDAQVPKQSVFQPDNIVKTLNQIISEVGGVDGLTSQERKLFRMVTGEDPVTYGRLMREKDAIGAALGRQDSPYSGVNQGALKRLYGALAEDQLANVERLGGSELRATLRTANQITAKQKGLEERIVNAFGKDMEGSVANALKLAVSQGAKGDMTRLNRVLKTIPKDLQKEAVASSIAALSQSRRAAEGGFGFSEFTKLYRGMRENSKVYSKVVQTLGPEAHQLMQDLYQVSSRIVKASTPRTGESNQALIRGMQANTLVESILQSTGGRAAVSAAGSTAGSVVGGVPGAGIGGALAGAMTGATSDKMALAGKLFRSEAFQRLAEEAAKGAPSDKAVKAATNSPAFRAWAKAAKINQPETWLAGILAATNIEKEAVQ